MEVDRRRSQGRLLRNLALPLAVWVYVPFPDTLGGQIGGVLVGLCTCGAIVVPYAYSEYVNFAEAYDISS